VPKLVELYSANTAAKRDLDTERPLSKTRAVIQAMKYQTPMDRYRPPLGPTTLVTNYLVVHKDQLPSKCYCKVGRQSASSRRDW
jgi:hypothetical protein